MKTISVIIAGALLTSSLAHAQPEAETKTVYVTGGTTLHFHTSKPFRNVYVGNDTLLTVTPGFTDRDLNVTANQPKGLVVDSANVLIVDEDGQVTDHLRVEVTPFSAPSRTITILKGTGDKGTVVQHCLDSRYSGGSSSCITAPNPASMMGDASSVSVTRWSDGSSSVSKTWSRP